MSRGPQVMSRGPPAHPFSPSPPRWPAAVVVSSSIELTGRNTPEEVPVETTENTAPTKSRREQMLAQLGEQAEKLRSSEGWLAWLKFARRFRNYSLGNQLLIQAQRPGAKLVAGYRSWESLGRHVKKGEKGIAILAPMIRKASLEEIEQEGALTVLRGFKPVFVFDLSQTEGDPIPIPEMPPAYISDEALFEQLILVATKADITTRVVDRAPDGVYGWWDHFDRIISIAKDQDIASKTATMLHELAHAFDPECESPASETAERELVAESAAFLVGTELGIDMREASSHYVMTYGATVERLLDLADEVLTVASKLSDLVAELPLPLAS